MSLRLCEQWFFMHLKKITSNIIQIIPEFQLILFNLVSYFILKHQNWLTYNTVRKSVALWIFIMRPFLFLFFLLLFSTSSLKLEAEFKDVFCIIYFLWLWLLVQNIYLISPLSIRGFKRWHKMDKELTSLSWSFFLCFFFSRLSSSVLSSPAGVSLPLCFFFLCFFFSLVGIWLRRVLYCSGRGPGCSLNYRNII